VQKAYICWDIWQLCGQGHSVLAYVADLILHTSKLLVINYSYLS
jgi:hypothetical protein